MGLSTGNLSRFYPFAVALEQCLYVVLLFDSFLFGFGCILSVCFYVCRGGVRSPGEVGVLVAPPYLGIPMCVSD